MTLVPIVGALLTGAGISQISDYYGSGLDRVMSVVVMFIFAIIYFGILSDVGLFEPVIKGLIKATRGNIVLVTLGTAAHLRQPVLPGPLARARSRARRDGEIHPHRVPYLLGVFRRARPRCVDIWRVRLTIFALSRARSGTAG